MRKNIFKRYHPYFTKDEEDILKEIKFQNEKSLQNLKLSESIITSHQQFTEKQIVETPALNKYKRLKYSSKKEIKLPVSRYLIKDPLPKKMTKRN